MYIQFLSMSVVPYLQSPLIAGSPYKMYLLSFCVRYYISSFLLIFQLNQAGNSLRVDKSDNHRTTSRCRWKHSFQIAACCFRNFDVWSSTNKFRYKSRWGSTGKTFHFYGIRFAFKPFTSFIFHQSCWEYFDTKIWASKSVV